MATMALRLGMPALLMVAFVLIGLATQPFQDAGRPSPDGRSLARADRLGGATRPRGAGVTAEPSLAKVPNATTVTAEPSLAEVPDTSVVTAETPVDTADEHEAPTPRLPSEVAPVAPDVVVALGSPERVPPRLTHAHIPAGVGDDRERMRVALEPAAQTDEDFQGAEPDTFYWFGPHGLERVRLLGGTTR